MTPEILNIIGDIGGIGAIIVFIIALMPILKALAKAIEAKINNNIPYDVQASIKSIETNHLTDLQKSMDRIEAKLEKLNDIENILVEIKAKLNKGR